MSIPITPRDIIEATTPSSSVECVYDGIVCFLNEVRLDFILALEKIKKPRICHEFNKQRLYRKFIAWGPLIVMYEPFNPEAAFMRLRINPKAGGLSRDQVLQILRMATADPKLGRIGEVHWALDFIGETPEGLRARFLILGARGKGPRLCRRSVYAGSRQGKTQMVLYDKADEERVHNKPVGLARARMEFRSKYRDPKSRPTGLNFLSGNGPLDKPYNKLYELKVPVDKRTAEGKVVNACGGWLNDAYKKMTQTQRKRLLRRYMLPATTVIDTINRMAEVWLDVKRNVPNYDNNPAEETEDEVVVVGNQHGFGAQDVDVEVGCIYGVKGIGREGVEGDLVSVGTKSSSAPCPHAIPQTHYLTRLGPDPPRPFRHGPAIMHKEVIHHKCHSIHRLATAAYLSHSSGPSRPTSHK